MKNSFGKICIVTSLGIMGTVVSHAQVQTVRGTLTDPTGAPISGASVKNLVTKKMVVTDADGKFTISGASGQKLSIMAIGYAKSEVIIAGATMSVSLKAETTTLQEVSVGSRGKPRTAVDLPVPVDVIKMNQVATTMSRPDLMSQLMVAVPSFNYNKQSGSDIGDAVDFATLRGMGYDHTLVLVNGKRRHISSYVSSTAGSSGSGSDLNTIPQGAIDHIEVLRDGASAQYGSDAIAGVLNVILKKDVGHFTMTTGWSGFYDHKYNTLKSADPSLYYQGSKVDGNAYTNTMDWGLSLGSKGGFLNISGNFLTQGKTFRGNVDNNVFTQTRRAFGDGSVTSGGGMYNLEIPLSSKIKLFSFGGYNYKHANSFAWSRKWASASNRIKFPTDANGNLIFVPSIMQVGSSANDSISALNVYYNPQEDVYMRDLSGTLGLKGNIGGWNWTLSNNTGRSDAHIFGNKTFNASLPLPQQYTKTRFDDGGFNYLLNVTNLDFDKHFSNVFQGLTLGWGAEFRYERYQIYAGEPDSYINGGALLNGAPKAAGAEGYPGYQPSDAVVAHRNNISGYINGTFDITKKWLVDLAARFENYSDFGFVNVYKIATRYKITDNFNIRGAFSSGFRAPTMQEMNFSNTNTTVVKNELVYTKLVPNYSQLARLAGIPKLKQETSLNYSIGFAYKLSNNFTATVDGYMIKLKNRVILTGNYDNSTPALADYMNANSLSQANFFANAANTTNKGIDVVLDYHNHWGENHFNVLVTGNIQKVTIDKINVPSQLGTSYLAYQQFFGTQPQMLLEASAPKAKFSINPEFGTHLVDIGLRFTYWGKIVKAGGGQDSLPGVPHDGPGGGGISAQGNGWDPYVKLDNGSGVVPEYFYYNPKVTSDIYVNFKFSKKIKWIVGVDNLFNVHSDPAFTPGAKIRSWNDNGTGGYFDNVQMGFNGMRMYSKLVFNF